MKNKKLRLAILALCALSFIGQLILYPRLPDTIPTHWNFRGEVDGYGSRNTQLFLSLLPLLLYGLFLVIPKIDPRGKNYQKHARAYDLR